MSQGGMVGSLIHLFLQEISFIIALRATIWNSKHKLKSQQKSFPMAMRSPPNLRSSPSLPLPNKMFVITCPSKIRKQSSVHHFFSGSYMASNTVFGVALCIINKKWNFNKLNYLCPIRQLFWYFFHHDILLAMKQVFFFLWRLYIWYYSGKTFLNILI